MRKGPLLTWLVGLLSLAGAMGAEVGVAGPVLAPIRHQPWWRLEEALWGYRPAFTPGIACFDGDNRAYLRWEEVIQTPDDAGQWLRLPFTQAPATLFPTWDGKFMQGYFADEHVVFDDAGDAYTTVNATRSSIGRIFLLHSRDRCRTWTAYPIGLGYPRLERRDGHSRLARPPALLIHDGGLRGVLQLVLPEKTANGALDVSFSRVVSEDSLLVDNHSGAGNSVISVGEQVIVAYPGRTALPGKETAGTPQYIVSYDRTARRLGPAVLLGLGGHGVPDAHNLPVIAVDSQGTIHAILGAHHEPFLYTRSRQPNSVTDGWTDPLPIGTPKRRAAEGSYTYVGLVCDPQDTLHVVGRWAGDSYTFRLAYLRKKKDQPWEANRDLVVPFKGNYHVWYHKLTIDRRGRLFLNYVCRAAIKRADEVPSFLRKWPTRAPEGDFLTQSHCLLLSEDGGDSWRLATSADLGAGAVTGTPPPTAPPPPPAPPAAKPRQVSALGGAFGPSVAWDHFLAVGVDRRVQVLDVADRTRPRLVGQTQAFGDQVLDVDIDGGILLIAAWRDGLHRCAVSADGRLSEPSRIVEGEARAFRRDGRRLLLCQGSSGLWLGELGPDGSAPRLGAFTRRHAYAVAQQAATAYVASGHQGLAVVDLTDPAQPRELRLLCARTSDTDRVNTAWNLALSGQRLYVCPGPAPASLRVFDIAAPKDPKELGRLENDWGWGRPLAFHAGHLWFSGLTGLRILTEADTPAEVGHWGKGSVGPLTGAGTTGFLSRGTLGLTLLDLTNPAAPSDIGNYAEAQTPFCVAAVDALRVLVADWGCGLRLLSAATSGLLSEAAVLPDLPRILGLDAQGDLAIAALGNDGVAVLGLRGLTQPTILARLATGRPVRDVALGEGVAFLAEAGGRLRVLGLADPARPEPLVVVETGAEVLALAATAGTLYAAAMQRVNGGIQSYRWQDGGLTALGHAAFAGEVWGMDIAGNTLTAAAGADGLWQFDLSDVAAPRLTARLQVESPAWDTACLGAQLCVARGADGLLVLAPP